MHKKQPHFKTGASRRRRPTRKTLKRLGRLQSAGSPRMDHHVRLLPGERALDARARPTVRPRHDLFSVAVAIATSMMRLGRRGR